MERHPLFIKYTRDWLHQSTGFSKNYLCKIATGRLPLTRSFIERVCYTLNQPVGNLFSPDGTPFSQAVSQQYLNECIKRTQERIQSLLNRAEKAQEELDNVSRLLDGWITAYKDLEKLAGEPRIRTGPSKEQSHR